MNYRVKLIEKTKVSDFSSEKASIGDLMIDDEGHIILKAYDFFVDLNDPTNTWSKNAEFECRLLKKGDVIKLKVK